uniref:Uncharacterized protein n=1 Tax=Cairina moschata TaxID=8855 RepID=A0A8C3C2G8_CAIMO
MSAGWLHAGLPGAVVPADASVLHLADVALVAAGGVDLVGDAPPDLLLLVRVHGAGGGAEEQRLVPEHLAHQDLDLLQREVRFPLQQPPPRRAARRRRHAARRRREPQERREPPQGPILVPACTTDLAAAGCCHHCL